MVLLTTLGMHQIAPLFSQLWILLNRRLATPLFIYYVRFEIINYLCFETGLDIPKHGESAYPAESYGHGWGEKGDTLAGLARKVVKSASATTVSKGELCISVIGV